MKILLTKDTKKFISLSGDNNKIHYDKDFAKNFFFKKPILHGMNVALSAFEFFLKTINYQVTIEEIEINFKNFCLSDEKLYLSLKKNKIIICGEINEKIEILFSISKNSNQRYNKKYPSLLKLYNFKKVNNLDLINNCIFLSKFVGTQTPGNGSLIHRMQVRNSVIKNLKLKVKNIVKNIKEIEYIESYKVYRVLCSKVKKFSTSGLIVNKLNTINKKINKKKILIFGIHSGFGHFTLNMLKKYSCLISHHSFRLNLDHLTVDKKMKDLVKRKIYTFNPDYIFYFSTPEIINVSRNSKLVKKLYESVYITYPRFIIDTIFKKNPKCKIFLPSSFVVNLPEKYPLLKEYIHAKIKMEKVFKKNKYQSNVFIARLPQFKNISNYNMLGFYEGKSIINLKSFIKSFINYNYEK